MAETTGIEWADSTFNPWVGCTKVSSACDNCYAEGWAKRAGTPELWAGERRRTSASNWQQPIKWNRAAEAAGIRRRVFCSSLADVFDNQVPAEWRADLWKLIEATPALDWLILTKRPQNMVKMLPIPRGIPFWPSENVWLGVTVENQEQAERRIPYLLHAPAYVHFLSCEPLLGPIDLRMAGGIGWVIAGGESGPGARPTNPQWFRDLRDQCVLAGIPFLFKQWGDWVSVSEIDGPGEIFTFPDDRSVRRVGKKKAGREIDGRTWTEFPEREAV